MNRKVSITTLMELLALLVGVVYLPNYFAMYFLLFILILCLEEWLVKDYAKHHSIQRRQQMLRIYSEGQKSLDILHLLSALAILFMMACFLLLLQKPLAGFLCLLIAVFGSSLFFLFTVRSK